MIRHLARTMPRSMRLAALALAAIAASVVAAPDRASAGDWRETEIAGREILVYEPLRLRGRPAPMLLVLHSDYADAESFARTFPIYRHADREGFRVAYVEGTAIRRQDAWRDWNAGTCCGTAETMNTNDMGFLRAVVDGAVAEGLTWPQSFFLFGHSNGAMMAYRFACTHPERVTGVIALAGTLAHGGCDDARGVRVLAIHGLLDGAVPYEGGRGDNHEGVDLMGVRDALNAIHHAGGSVDLVRLHFGGHAWGEMKRSFAAEQGYPLEDRVLQFIDTHAFR